MSWANWLISTMLAAGLSVAPDQGKAAPAIVFRDVNVLPMDRDVVLPHQAVLVADGKISAIEPDQAVRIPAGATVIDGHGGFLMPGLVDFHTHPQAPEELTSDLAYGVTTVVGYDGEIVDWNRWGLTPPSVAAQMLGTTHILEGISQADTAYAVRSPEDVPALLDHEQSLGADLVKIYVHMTLPELKALAREGHARGMPVTGHIPVGLPQQDVLSGQGLDLIAHSEEFKRYLSWQSSDAEYDSVVRRVASHRIGVIANLVAVHAIEGQATALPKVMSDPQVAYLSSTAYQGWLDRNNDYSHRPEMTQFVAGIRSLYSVQQKVVRKLNDSGVLLLLGTDAPVDCVPGVCVHEELALLTEAGLSTFDALRSATFNAGAFVTTEIRARSTDRFGVVAPGAEADLILVDANPLLHLDALRKPAGVMVRGVWRNGVQLQQAREALLPELRRRHQLIDQYESLYVAGDMNSLVRFLDSTHVSGAPLLDQRILCRDALALANKGKLAESINLLRSAEHLTADSFLIHNTLGRILLMKGDRQGAAEEFRYSLKIDTNNAGAEIGLEQATGAGAGH